MNDREHNLIDKLEQLKHLRLSEDRRTRIWKELSEYADFHPVPADGGQLLSWWQIGYVRLAGIALLGVLMVSGGTAAAAQGAVPGEWLYGVKLGFNERVRSAVAWDATAKAVLAADLLAERIDETEQLIAAGEVDSDRIAAASARIEAYAEAADRLAGHTDAATRLAVRSDIDSLLVHTRRLALSVNPTLARRPLSSPTLAYGGGSSASAAMMMDSRGGAVASPPAPDSAVMLKLDAAPSTVDTATFAPDPAANQLEARLQALVAVIDAHAADIDDARQVELNTRLQAAAERLAASAAVPAVRQTVETMLAAVEADLADIATPEYSESTGLIIDLHFSSSSAAPPPTTFADCVAAGNPILETYPEQCRAGGVTFSNPDQAIDIDEEPATEPSAIEDDLLPLPPGELLVPLLPLGRSGNRPIGM